ncbi:MAG: hypothetical protein JW821_16120, partial [Deltaproteobacteria bacterium]|nr:hypothetical protein [Deltaproteobacteria bacterium]
VARGTTIRPVRSRDELLETVKSHVAAPGRRGVYRGREKFELAAAALVSVFFVAAVWFGFTRGQDTMISLQVPIEYMNRDPGMEILETSENQVSLELSGSGPLIRSIRPDQVQVRLDLSRGEPGTHTYSVTPDTVRLPPGISLRGIRTQEVAVTLDVLVKKDLPVQADWTGGLPVNLILTEVRVEPATIEIVGGRGVVKNIATIYTEKIPLDQIQRSGTMTVKILTNIASVRIAPGQRDRVTVHYTVKEREGQGPASR